MRGDGAPSRPSVAAVQAAACVFYGTTLADLKGRSRKQIHSWPRHSAIAVARRLTGLSSPMLGRLFGERHHATVLQSCRFVARREASNTDYRAELAEIVALAQRLSDRGDTLPTGAGLSRDVREPVIDHFSREEIAMRAAWKRQIATAQPLEQTNE